MAQKRYMTEQIIGMLRELEVRLDGRGCDHDANKEPFPRTKSPDAE